MIVGGNEREPSGEFIPRSTLAGPCAHCYCTRESGLDIFDREQHGDE